jgi:hypothetical protein
MQFIRKYKIDDWESVQDKILLAIDMVKDNNVCEYANMSYSDYKVDAKPLYWEVFENAVRSSLEDYMSSWKCNDIRIGNMWFAEYTKGADFNWHTHEGCNMSGVLQIVLEDKDNATQLLGTPIDLEEGDLVLFPSMLPHRSPMLNDSHKIVIGFNWDICGSELHDN